MWGYYGSKSKIVNKYPPPQFGKIIEPFAGTAQYALKYFDRDVTLVDKYPVIIQLWKWLQQCSPNDILKLPRLKEAELISSFHWDCDEAKWLMGFIISGAPTSPRNKATRWKTTYRPNTQDYKLNMIANNLHKIRHWNIIQGDYLELPNETATWFIDPPYQFGGECYKFGNRQIDYPKLKDWSLNRMGEIIVCENSKSDWMNFTPLVKMFGSKYTTTECIYHQINN